MIASKCFLMFIMGLAVFSGSAQVGLAAHGTVTLDISTDNSAASNLYETIMARQTCLRKWCGGSGDVCLGIHDDHTHNDSNKKSISKSDQVQVTLAKCKKHHHSNYRGAVTEVEIKVCKSDNSCQTCKTPNGSERVNVTNSIFYDDVVAYTLDATFFNVKITEGVCTVSKNSVKNNSETTTPIRHGGCFRK